MAERSFSAPKNPNSPVEFVYSLRWQSYNSMAGHGESEHVEEERPLEATGLGTAIQAARGMWSQLIRSPFVIMENGYAHPDGRGRASEYFHPVVYPHSPKLGYSMDLMQVEGFEPANPAVYLEELRRDQENNPDRRRPWGLLTDYLPISGESDAAEREAFGKLWPAVRNITRLTEHYVAFVNNRIYFQDQRAELMERITHEQNHQSAFVVRIGEIKR